MNNNISAFIPNILGKEMDGKITFTFANSALLDAKGRTSLCMNIQYIQLYKMQITANHI